MAVVGPLGYAFNQTRSVYLATQLRVAETHWRRLRGLMWSDPAHFVAGQGLWIVPSHGVHTFAMRFPIDVAYLGHNRAVLHMEHNLKPWRVAPLSMRTGSILELPAGTLRSTGTSVGDVIEIAVGSCQETIIA